MIPDNKLKMKDIAYSSIREKILSGEISPRSSISEDNLAKLLGISRTPVREAILMLEADGFVKIFPNKGPVVTSLHLDDIIWISQIREGLEGIAARIACDKADKQKLSEIKEKLESLTDLDDKKQMELSFQYGREIHKEMMNCTENKRMIKIVDNMTQQLNRIMLISRMAPERCRITYDQHLSIIDAIVNKDYEKAEKDVRNHIRSVCNDAMNVYRLSYL